MPASSSGGGLAGNSYSPGSRYDVLHNAPEEVESPNLRRKRRNVTPAESFFFKSTTAKDLMAGPKFLVMTRKDADPNATMRTISPFLINLAITQATGEVRQIKRLQDGTVLIETNNNKQAVS